MRLRICVRLTALVAVLVCSFASSAQSRARNESPRSRQPDSAAHEIAGLLEAEQRAQQRGDPAAVASASGTLTAALLRQLATLQVVDGKPAEAAELYRRSLGLADSPEVRLELASTLLRSGHPTEAASEAGVVTSANPQDAAAWAVRGSALRIAGKEADAVNALTHSLKLRSDVNVAYALGSALLAVHDKARADLIFRQIITSSGDDAVWHVAVGDAYREAGYLLEATNEFKAAIARDSRAAHAEFFLGLTYLQMNQWGPNSQSFEHLRAAIRQSPHDYVSNFYLGALESTDGSDLASSDHHLRAAAETDPSQPEVWLYLGLNANREKDTAAAKRYLQKAIDLTGADEARNGYQVRRAYFALGRILIADGDRAAGDALLAKYKRAEQAAVAESGASIAQVMGAGETNHTAASLASSTLPVSVNTEAAQPQAASPQLSASQQLQLKATEVHLRSLLASSYNDLGTAEARQRQYPLALAHFQQAELFGTPSPALLHNLGIAAFRIDNFSEAVRALTLYLDQSPADVEAPRARLMLAFSQFSSGQFPAAAKSFGEIRVTVLQDSRAAYSWAFSLARSGQQQQANTLTDDLVKRDLPPDVLPLVCHLYTDTEDYEQSASCYRKVYMQDSTAKLAHYEVGQALIHLDRPAEAIPELRKELELSGENPNVEAALAFALLQTSQKAEGESLLRKVTVEAPEQAEGQYQYGKLLLEQGKTVEAILHLESAAKLDPDKDYVHYQLQSAYRKAGRTVDAAREAEIFRDLKAKHREAVVPQPALTAGP